MEILEVLDRLECQVALDVVHDELASDVDHLAEGPSKCLFVTSERDVLFGVHRHSLFEIGE